MIEEILVVFYTALALAFLASLVQLARGGKEAAAQAQSKIGGCIIAGIAIVVAMPVMTYLFDIKTFNLQTSGEGLDASYKVTNILNDVAYPNGTCYYRGSTVTGGSAAVGSDWSLTTFVSAVKSGKMITWGSILDKVINGLYIVGGLLVAVGIMIAAIELRLVRRKTPG
jgi:hypothetical protein